VTTKVLLRLGLIVDVVVLLVSVGLAADPWAWHWGGEEGANVTDNAVLKESIEVGVTRSPDEVRPGGPEAKAEAARVGESVEYIIRDASGNIKERKVIGAK